MDYSPETGFKYTQKFLFDKKIVSHDGLRNSPELRSHRSRIVTLSNQSNFWKVNLSVFTGASPFSYRFWFCSHGYTMVSVVNISHKIKQRKSHLLTKFIKHLRTRGKFILLNLKSIGKIVESFAFKIYRIVVCS